MPKSFDEQLKVWQEKQEKKIAAAQAEIVEFAMGRLFTHSPHEGSARCAKGVYDASHKISINGSPVGRAEGPTHSRAVSQAKIDMETAKTDLIKSGDRVTITNESGHAREVEYGELETSSWKSPGYAPFSTALANIKARYRNVLK